MVYQCKICKHFYPRVDADGVCKDCKEVVKRSTGFDQEKILSMLTQVLEDNKMVKTEIEKLRIEVDTLKASKRRK